MAHLNARQRGAQNYWARKLQAFHTFGAALSRPQVNFRNYMLEKRRVNYGYITRMQLNEQTINGFQLNIAGLPPTPPLFNLEAIQLQDFRFTWVDTEESFTQMMADIVRSNEIALDLECNNEHSYYGMSCLIQIATYNRIYLLDPFSQFDNITLRLKPVLEATRCKKILHGSINDILTLNKDYGINIAGLIDTQLVHQQLLLVAQHAVESGNLANLQNHDFQEILWRSTRRQDGSRKTAQDLAMEATQMISLTNLANLYLPNQPHPNDLAQLSDWRIRPIANVNMQQYAVFDVFVLLKIWAKMKRLITLQPNANAILQHAAQASNALAIRHFIPPADQTAEQAIQQVRVPARSQQLFRVVFAWKTNYAKMIDESSNEILSAHEINQIVSTNANTDIQIRGILGRRRIPCESLNDWIGLLVQLMTDGETFWLRLQTRQCHVCGPTGINRWPHPHVAFGCAEPYSTQATREYFQDPNNQQQRLDRERRSRERWAETHPGVPYPRR